MKKKAANLRWITRVAVLTAMLATTVMTVFVSSPPVFAATITTTGSGNWNSTSPNAPWPGGTVPLSTDSVIIASGHTVTVTATATIVGVTINDGAELKVGNTFTVNGITTVGGGTSGTLNISTQTGTKTFVGLVTINSGGTWTNPSNEGVTFRGGITNSGTFTAGTGLHTFNTNAQALTGTFSIPSVTVTGVTLTNNNTLTVGTALSGTGGLTQAAGATLNIGGTSAITTLTATDSGNTVNYNGAGQTVKGTTYNNLTLSGTLAKTFPAGTTTVDHNFLRQGTANLTFVGSFVNNGGLIDCGNAAITISGTQATQSIAGFTTTGAISVTKATTTPSTITITNDVNAASLSFTTAASNTTVSLDSGVALALTGGLTIYRPATASTTGSTLAVNDGSLSCSTITLGGTTGVLRTSTITISTGTVTASGSITSAGVASRIIFSNAGTLYAGGTFMSGTAGTFTCSAGTVNFNANGAQSIAPFAYTFNNVILSGSGAKTTTNANINGILSMEGTATTTGTVATYGAAATLQYNTATARTAGVEWRTPFTASGGVIIANTGTITLNNAKVISASLTINSGATLDVNASNYALTVNGSWINNGTFTQRSGTVTLSGPSAQTMSGATTFYNLIMNNSNGLIINNDETISNTLTLTNGQITTGSNTIIITAAGSVSRTDGHIIGNLQKYVATGATSRTFEVGTAIAYNPVTIAFGNVATAGNLTATVTSGQHPNIGTSTIDSSKDVNEYWSLTSPDVVFDSYSATFNFVAGDILGGADPSNFIVGEYSSGWTYPTAGTKTSTSTQATGLTYFGEFAVGETAIIPITIEITAPTDIPDFPLNIEINSITTSTLNVTVSSPSVTWSVTACDSNTGPTKGFMTSVTANLSKPMWVAGHSGAVDLSTGINSVIAQGTGTNTSVGITFTQEVTWDDEPGDYQIVVQFIATVNP